MRLPTSTSLVRPLPHTPAPWQMETMTDSKKNKSFGAASQLASAPVQEGICTRETLRSVKILHIILINSPTVVLGFRVSVSYRGKLKSL